MNLLAKILLEAATNNPNDATASDGFMGILMSALPIVLVVVVFYFFLIRPQKKQEKEANEMRNSLEIGDEVVTIGGLRGTVVSVKDEKFVMETSADQVRIELAKWAISSNETATAAAKAEAKKRQEEKAKAKAAKKAGK